MFQHLTPYCISGDGHPSILLGGTEVDDLELPGLITSLLTLACLSDWYIFPGIRSFAVEVSRYASSLRLRVSDWLTNQTARTLSRVSVNSYTAFCVSCAVVIVCGHCSDSELLGLALDTKRNLYYTDSRGGVIGEMKTDGSNRRELLKDRSKHPRAIVVDSINRWTKSCWVKSSQPLSSRSAHVNRSF